MSGNDVLAWLLTYLLHSTLLLCLAWLVAGSRLGRRSASLTEALWRFALFAAPVTALLQLAAGREPLAGRLALASPVPERAAELAWPSTLSVAEAVSAPAAPWFAGISATEAALGLWILGALLLGLRLAWSWTRFLRRVALRPRVVGGGLRERLDRLAGAGVRLTTSSRVSVPFALGLRRGEVCVPPRALLGLSDEEQEGMLAHELAHVVRRDPAWLLAVNAFCAVFFFQPLNWVARRRLRELSEVLSDSRAVEQTGRPLSLARCLTEVAGWSLEARPLPVPGMADRPSHLAQRVSRLLDGTAVRRVRPAWLILAGALLLAAVAICAPVISADAPGGEPPAERPAVAEESEDDDLAEELENAGLSDREIARIRREVEAAHAEARAARERIERDLEPVIARAHKELERSLAGQLAELDDLLDDKTRADLERLGREVEENLAPHLDQINEEIERSLQPELERLEAELEALGVDVEHRLSAEQADRLREMTEHLSREAGRHAMSSEALRQAVEQARRHALEQAAVSAAVRQTVEQAQRSAREAVEQALEQHRAQMEQLRHELDAEAQAMAEQIRREIEKSRRERRSRDERRPPGDKEREPDEK